MLAADLPPKFLSRDGYLWVVIEFLHPTLRLFLMPWLQWKRLAGISNVLPKLLHDLKLVGNRQFSKFFQFD